MGLHNLSADQKELLVKNGNAPLTWGLEGFYRLSVCQRDRLCLHPSLCVFLETCLSACLPLLSPLFPSCRMPLALFWPAVRMPHCLLLFVSSPDSVLIVFGPCVRLTAAAVVPLDWSLLFMSILMWRGWRVEAVRRGCALILLLLCDLIINVRFC